MWRRQTLKVAFATGRSPLYLESFKRNALKGQRAKLLMSGFLLLPTRALSQSIL